MRRSYARIIVAICLAVSFDYEMPLLAAPATNTQTIEFHTTEPGETWTNISAHYGIGLRQLWLANGVTNPQNLAAGQRLLIPDSAKKLGQAQDEHVILTSNSTMLGIATQTGYPIYAILLINGLEDQTVAVGSIVVIPHRNTNQANGGVLPPPTVAPATAGPTPSPLPGLVGSRLGIQGYFGYEPNEMDGWLKRVEDAGFTWVKFQVSWKATEYPPDQYPLMGTLDSFMNNAQRRHLNVLLSVAKAPDWARDILELDGPPRDYLDYTSFVQLLANRFRGLLERMQVAFEIWNEPNTQREWNGAPISAADYVSLLTGAYVAIKNEDQRYTVISAGLAPTGINDGLIALEDREFLREMYQAGLARVTDAIGIHPYGWANPPQIRCCKDPAGPQIYDDDPHFFFLNTIEDYRAIQGEFGDSDLRDLWATEFGWATMSGIQAPIPDSSPWFAYMTPEQQATYDRDAFLLMQDKDFMGPMFLWNLNMSTLINFDPDHAGYSVYLPPHKPRPAYELIRNSPKIVLP